MADGGAASSRVPPSWRISDPGVEPGPGVGISDPGAGGLAIRTRRLVLAVMSPATMTAVLTQDWPAARRLVGAEFPDEWRGDRWVWLADCISAAESDAAAVPWGPRLLLRTGTDGVAVVGQTGFHGRPDQEGVAEFGYMIVRAYRRQGFAEEAVRSLLGWAQSQPEVRRFRATVDPANEASIGLLRKVGFAEIGRRSHVERGEELVFQLAASRAG